MKKEGKEHFQEFFSDPERMRLALA